jgi:hypothetical protein
MCEPPNQKPTKKEQKKEKKKKNFFYVFAIFCVRCGKIGGDLQMVWPIYPKKIELPEPP